jgi:hypothetical protein
MKLAYFHANRRCSILKCGMIISGEAPMAYFNEEAALPHLRSLATASKRLPAKLAIPAICVLSVVAWVLVISAGVAVWRLV